MLELALNSVIRLSHTHHEMTIQLSNKLRSCICFNFKTNLNCELNKVLLNAVHSLKHVTCDM